MGLLCCVCVGGNLCAVGGAPVLWGVEPLCCGEPLCSVCVCGVPVLCVLVCVAPVEGEGPVMWWRKPRKLSGVSLQATLALAVLR